MAAQQKVVIDIPEGYPPEVREAIAQEIVDFIVNRTASGRDKDGDKFVKYDKEYADEKGVSRSKVDLVQTGDMLNALSVLKVGTTSITIGYEKGDEINGQVEGNRLGSYGGDPDPSRARDFLGISNVDLKKILKKYPDREEIRDLRNEFNKLTPEQKRGLYVEYRLKRG